MVFFSLDPILNCSERLKIYLENKSFPPISIHMISETRFQLMSAVSRMTAGHITSSQGIFPKITHLIAGPCSSLIY